MCVAFENLEGNALLSESLGETEPAQASSDNEYMHVDDFEVGNWESDSLLCFNEIANN